MEKETEDRVREMAYLMWEQAGRQMGMAAEFWLAAEREVLKTMSAMAGACAPGKPTEIDKDTAPPGPNPQPADGQSTVAARPEPISTTAETAPAEPSEVAVTEPALTEITAEAATPGSVESTVAAPAQAGAPVAASTETKSAKPAPAKAASKPRTPRKSSTAKSVKTKAP